MFVFYRERIELKEIKVIFELGVFIECYVIFKFCLDIMVGFLGNDFRGVN